MTRDAEALVLRDEWVRLQAEGSALAALTERLADSDDVVALRAHHARLHQHHTELHALTKAMEQFHHRYGAVGGLEDQR